MPVFELKITEIGQETNDLKVFFLEAPTPGSIPYKAGQYLTFEVPGSSHIRRSYSLGSTPGVDERMFIGVKKDRERIVLKTAV